MPSWTTPTPETVDRAVASMVHLEQQRYFFDHLSNPHWVRPLRMKGFFSTPPQPRRDSAQGTIEVSTVARRAIPGEDVTSCPGSRG